MPQANPTSKEGRRRGLQAAVQYLSPDLVNGDGKIEKLPLLSFLNYVFPRLAESFSELSILKVPEGMGIREHPHTSDEEWYVVLSNNGVEMMHCACGESHSYYNDTGDRVFIIAIKQLAKTK